MKETTKHETVPKGRSKIRKIVSYATKFVVLPLLLATILLGGIFCFMVYQQPSLLNAYISEFTDPDELPQWLYYPMFDIYIDPAIGDEKYDAISNSLLSINFEGRNRYKIVQNDVDADIVILARFEQIGDETNIAQYNESDIYVPVGHMYWIRDGVTSAEVEAGELLTKPQYLETIETAFPAATVSTSDDLLGSLAADESVPALIPLQDLNPSYKLLQLDEAYLLDDIEAGGYVRTVDVIGQSADLKTFVANVDEIVKTELTSDTDTFVSIDQDSILSLRMTGVTAISRNLAIKVDRSGDGGYPATKIASFLASTDLTHTSNEVSFVPGCVPTQSLSFCSAPGYLETLTDSGIDIVELTGNHNNDYGSNYNASTQQTYVENGMRYFGGGSDETDAAKILYEEIDGSKVALMGYNFYNTYAGPGALAAGDRPGANAFSFDKIERDIETAKSQGAIAIVTVQYQECYSYPATDVIYPPCYRPLSNPDQRADFRKIADLGADIVIGTQAHQPQSYEIYGDSYIYYGLGNLFFDQIPWIGTRQGLILTHYFYSGRYIQTKIDTTLYGNDMQTYVTEGEDRRQLLNLLKDAR